MAPNQLVFVDAKASSACTAVPDVTTVLGSAGIWMKQVGSTIVAAEEQRVNRVQLSRNDYPCNKNGMMCNEQKGVDGRRHKTA